MLSRPAGRFFSRLCAARGRASRPRDCGSRIVADHLRMLGRHRRRITPQTTARTSAPVSCGELGTTPARARSAARAHERAHCPSRQLGGRVRHRRHSGQELRFRGACDRRGGPSGLLDPSVLAVFGEFPSRGLVREIEGVAIGLVVHGRGKLMHGQQLGGPMLVFAGSCWFLLVLAGLCWYLLVCAGLCWASGRRLLHQNHPQSTR